MRVPSLFLVFSAVFFGACGWANVNDPDPELWVTYYVVFGSLSSVVLFFLSSHKKQQESAKGKGKGQEKRKTHGKPGKGANDGDDDAPTSVFRWVPFAMTLLGMIASAYCIYILWVDLHDPYMEALEQVVDTLEETLQIKHFVSPDNIASASWALLEFEAGREVVGAVLVFLHNFFLFHYVLLQLLAHKKDSLVYMLVDIHRQLLLTFMVGALAFSLYLWVTLQPKMNEKYHAKHCKGAFEF
eukprot:m.247209 g.247209  ORF g.247209 m.247209 type:complete len:242 (+) comp77547_c0_seq1:120-845(+)